MKCVLFLHRHQLNGMPSANMTSVSEIREMNMMTMIGKFTECFVLSVEQYSW